MDSDDVRAAGTVTAVVDGGLKMITNIKVVAVGEGSSRLSLKSMVLICII